MRKHPVTHALESRVQEQHEMIESRGGDRHGYVAQFGAVGSAIYAEDVAMLGSFVAALKRQVSRCKTPSYRRQHAS